MSAAIMLAYPMLAAGFAVLTFGPRVLSRRGKRTYAEAWALTRRLTYLIWGAGIVLPALITLALVL